MALSFDTPSRLERRIAQDMLDDSDDLSLPGLGRRAPLEASYSALSESTFEEPHDEDEDEDPTQLTPAANRSNNRTTASSRTSTTATARPPATLASVLAQSEQTGQTTATPRSTGSSSRTQAQRTQSHRAPSPNRSSVSSDSSMFTDRPRSPPLTSTPQGSSVGMRTQGTIMSQHSDGTSRFNLANRVTASAAAAAANDSRGRMGLANRSGNGSTTTSRWGESQNLSARSRHSSLREGETNRDESQYLSRLATRSVGDFSLSTGSIKSDPNQSMGGSRSARDVEVIDQPNSDPVLSSPVEVQKGAEADAEGATAPVADETAASERNDSQQGHSQDNATGTMHTSDIAPSFNINNARMAPSSAFRDLLPGSPADRSASLRGDTSQDDMSISSAKRDQNRHLEGEPTPRSNKSAPIHDSSRSSDSLSHDSSRSTRAGNRARTLATAAYNRPASALDYASEHTDGERDLPDLSRSRSDGEHDESTDGRSTPSNREMLPASSPYRRPRSQAIVSSLDSPKPQAFAPGWRRPPRTSAFRESSLAEEDQATESDASAGQDTPTSTAPRQQSAQSHIMQEPPGAESEADTLDATSSPSARAQKRLAVLTDVATPRQTPSQTAADIERRKAFLLNSVRATNSLLHRHKARSGSVRGTPISGRGFREGSMAPSDAGASTGDSSGVLGPLNTVGAGRTPVPRGVLGRPVADTDSFASETSSNDLTVPIGGGMRANTSFPGIGAADQASGGSALGRVDPQKLARYQQKINSQLEEENVALRGEKDALTRNLNKALRDLEFLRKRTPGNEGTDGELSAATSSANLPLSPSDEAHARGMHRVGRRSDSEHGDASTSAKVEGATAEELAAAQTRIAELDNEAQELADALDEREAELAQVRKELADAQVERTRAPLHGGDAEDAEDVVRDLQNQPFDLKDQLAEANRVRTQQEEELKRLQAALESAQHQGEASRHDQGDEELRAQIDGLEEAVRARNTDIEALEASAAEAQNRFDAQITQLREQVETHCDELEERLSGERQEARDAEAEAKQRARDLQDVLDEREMQLQRARTERDEALRQHNNDDAAAELTRLQDRIGELSDELTRAKQDARRAHEKADELSALETQMSEREATLKQTASSLGDAQARVQELEQNLEDLQEQERLNARDVQDYQEANAELERQLDELEAEARRTQEELMQEREQLQSALQQAERRAHEARVEMVELVSVLVIGLLDWPCSCSIEDVR